jgi:hypothetical protein
MISGRSVARALFLGLLVAFEGLGTRGTNSVEESRAPAP